MEINADIKEMARRCYGYGRWSAPYWFIGLGEGMSPGTSVEKRAEAWRELEREGLSDCRAFHLHRLIGDKRWHVDRVEIQKTWRPLRLLLKTFRGEEADKESLRKYQRDCWGMRDNNACVIELFGLPAPTFKAYKALMRELFTQRQIDEILQERIHFIRTKKGALAPKLVVMYGRGAREQWEEIGGQSIVER